MDFEIKIIEFLQGARSPFFDTSFQILSLLGSFLGIAFLVVLLLFLNRRLCFCFLFSYGISAVFAKALKVLVARVRPFNVSDVIVNIGGGAEDFSFPSGHATCAAAIGIFMAYFLFKYFKNNYARVGIVLCCSIYVGLVCLSRMYLGKHYLTDLIAGVAISAIICVGGILIMRFLEKRKGKKNEN